MKTCRQSLPGIKNVGWIYRKFLPKGMEVFAMSGEPAPILTDIHKLLMFDNPTLDVERDMEDRRQSETATLTFRTLDSLPLTGDLVFIATDNNGISYLIGSDSLPNPKVTSKKSVAGPDTANITEYTVSYKARKAIVLCLINDSDK